MGKKIENNIKELINELNNKKYRKNKDIKNKEKKKNKFNFKKLLKYFFWSFVFLIILYNNIYLFSLNNSRFDTNIFNTKLYIIEDEMMEDTLSKGDIAIINTKYKEYNIDDIILFKDQSGIKLQKIVEITSSNIDESKKVYITKFNKSFYLNNFNIEENMVIGKYTRKISNFAWLLKILRSKITTIIIIMILLIILFLLIQIRLYKPTRGIGIDEDETLINQLKMILSKNKEDNKKLRGRHSRKEQKKKVRKRVIKDKRINKDSKKDRYKE